MNGPRCRHAGSRPAQPLCTNDAPAAGDVAMLLQTVVGAWPIDLDPGDRAGRTAFAERLAAWQQKALREAKLFTDWAAVDETYEAAARRFTLALIAEGGLPDLLAEIAAFVRRIAPAGAVNGLAQCLLRLTVPGRARSLSRHRVLGFQPGRSRQPPAGRFRRARVGAPATAISAPWPERGATAASSRP